MMHMLAIIASITVCAMATADAGPDRLDDPRRAATTQAAWPLRGAVESQFRGELEAAQHIAETVTANATDWRLEADALTMLGHVAAAQALASDSGDRKRRLHLDAAAYYEQAGQLMEAQAGTDAWVAAINRYAFAAEHRIRGGEPQRAAQLLESVTRDHWQDLREHSMIHLIEYLRLQSLEAMGDFREAEILRRGAERRGNPLLRADASVVGNWLWMLREEEGEAISIESADRAAHARFGSAAHAVFALYAESTEPMLANALSSAAFAADRADLDAAVVFDAFRRTAEFAIEHEQSWEPNPRTNNIVQSALRSSLQYLASPRHRDHATARWAATKLRDQAEGQDREWYEKVLRDIERARHQRSGKPAPPRLW